MPKLSNTLVSINEAASILGVSKKTLRRWEAAGKLTAVRTEGGHRRYSVVKLENFKQAQKEAKRAKRTKPNVDPITPIEAPTPFQAFPQTPTEPQQNTSVSPIVTSTTKEESIYTPLHINQARILKNFSRFSFATIALFVVAKILFTIPSLALNFSNNSNFAEKVSFLALLNKNEVTDQNGQVLATRDSLLSSRLDINIEATFAEDVNVEGSLNLNGNTITSADDLTISPLGGAVIIGEATATNADLADGDLVISGDFEANANIFAVNSALTGNQVIALNLTVGGDTTTTGDTSTGSLTINDETFTDLTGTGLAINNGVLETTLGGTITGAEIEDGTITETDLNITNTAGDNQILSYDSGTGTFTWVDDQTGETSPWTDAGSLIYADTTTDNLTLGGSTELAKLGIDGDTDEIQLLVQAYSTQTNDLVVFEQSDGTDLVTFDNDGQITFSPTVFGSSFTLYGTDTTLDSGDTSIIDAINTAYNTAAAGGLWTDGGAITYLGSTTDDLALGGTDNTSPFYMDVSTGILALTGGVNVNSETVSDFTGNGLTLSSGALTVNPLASADGLSATTSSGSGLEVLASGIGIIQGCSNGEILKWNEATDVWACASDAGATSAIINVEENGTPIGTDVDTLNFLPDFDLVDNTSTIDIQIADNALDFTELTNTLALDDNTSITTNAYALSIDSLTFDGTSITSSGALSLDDSTLSSAITLSDTDTSFASGDTAIVDAINTAYNAATGGTGSLLSHADHYLYATEYWADDFIVGGNSTASADIQLFADGSAVFNQQGNDADFRVEGDTEANLLFADASTNRVGIGINTPEYPLHVAGQALVELGGNSAYFRVQNSSSTQIAALGADPSGDGTLYMYDSTGTVRNLFTTDGGNSYISQGNLGIGDTTPAALFTVGASDAFQINSSGNITNIGGIAHTIGNSSGNLAITSPAEITFDDINLSSAIKISEDDATLPNSNIGIVDAINDAYTLAAAADPSTTNELQDLFSTISVSGQNDVVADANSDTLTLAAGSGVTITTDDTTDTITVSATGTGGDVVGPASSTDNAIARFDLATGKLIQNSGVIIDDSNNVSGLASLTLDAGGSLRTSTSATNTALLQAYDVDGASYTTFGTLTAGNTPTFDLSTDVTINSAYIYRVGGTDVSLADGGTGASLSDPGADRILFWDDTAGSSAWLAADGTSVEISGTTLQLVDGSSQASVDNSGQTVIQDITLDTYGRVTGLASVDLSSSFDNYANWNINVDSAGNDAIGSGDALNVNAGTNVSLTYTAGTNTLEIAATDTNTTYSAGNDLDLSGTTFNIEPELNFVNSITRDSDNLALSTTTSGNVSISAAGDVSFDDGTLSSAITLTDTDTSFTSGDTGIVDAINAAYAAATGSSEWTLLSGALFANNPYDTDIIIGGNATASADTQFFANGAAVFNQQGNNADFRIEGDTDNELFMVDASTDNVGIGYLSPAYKLAVDGTFMAASYVRSPYFADHDNVTYRLDPSNVGYSLLVAGSVGIGDTTPASLFTVGASDAFQINTSGNIVNIGGVAHTIGNSAGNLAVTSPAEISFDDINLTSAVKISEDDATLPNSNTGIVDAINDAYTLASAADPSTTNELQDLFSTFSVSGQSDVVADANSDTLTLAAGSNVTITTDAGTDTITIASTDTDTTYSAGNDLDLSGTTFNIESELNFVNSITRDSGNLALSTTTSGDITLSSAAAISFNDSNLSSAITLTDTDTAFTSGDTAIVDAINSAYAAATGSSEWTLLSGALFANNPYDTDILIGGNSTASADIHFLADGSAVFNQQGADADFRIEGDTDTNLFFADASTDNIGIGTNSPDTKLEVVDTSSQLRVGYNATNYSDFQVNSNGSLIISTTADTNGVIALQSTGQIQLGGNSTTSYINALDSSNTEGFRLRSSGASYILGGNVGIGDSSPASLLTVGNGDLFQVNSSGNIASIGGVAHTIADASGDLTLTSNADLFFNDSVQTSALALSDIDDGFDSGDTAIVDAINTAYNAATGGGGSGVWTLDSNTIYPTSSDDRVGIGTTTAGSIVSKLYVSGNANLTGKSLAILNQTESEDIFTASASGTTRFAIANNGEVRLYDTDASHYSGFVANGTTTEALVYTLPAADGSANQVLATDSNGNLSWIDATAGSGGVGDITAVGDVDTAAAFTETAGDDGNSLWFEGTTVDGNELQLTAADVANDTTVVTLPAITGTLASLAGSQTFTGAKTFSGGITNSAGELLVSGGNVQLNDSIALTFGTGDDTSIQFNGTDALFSTAGDFNFTAADDFIFDDAQLTAAVTLTDVDTSLPNSNTGIVDAINDAYTLAAAADNYGSWTVSDGVTTAQIDSTETLQVNGTGITVTVAEATPNTLTLVAADTSATNELQNVFQTISVSGQSDVVSDANSDTLTFAAGSNVTITTDAGTDTVTIAATDTNTTYSAGNDLDLSGTTFNIESELNFVNSITQASANLALSTTTSGDITLTAADNISFDDGTLSSAITLSDTDTSFASGDTGIVDAINAAYNAATGGTGALLTHADHYLYATDYWADDFIVGGNSTASADIQLFANGAAVFNQQGNDADFRIEGDTDANLFFADASTDRIGIGTNTPTSKLSLTDGRFVISGTSGTGEAINVSNSEIVNFDRSTVRADRYQGSLVSNQLEFRGGTSNTRFLASNGSTELLTLMDSGNFGIGDATPASLFTVGASDAFQINSSGNIINIGGVAHTIGNSAGNLAVTSPAEISFDDVNLSSAIKISEDDATLPNSNTGIVDAINDAYTLAAAADNYGSWNINVDSAGNDPIGSGDALLVNAGSNVTLTYTAGTNTLEIASTDTDTTYSAGNDLDLSGTTFNIESELNFVNSITRDSGTLALSTTTSGDITLSSAGDISFDDSTLSSAITLTDTATSFTSGDTAIVDAINAAYNAATGGTGALLTHADHYLYATDYWADDFIVGGNATSSADIQLFANGAANFNFQNADADFRVDGTNDYLLYGDASTNRVGIGTNTPSGLLHISGDTTERAEVRLTNTDGGSTWYINKTTAGVNFGEATVADNRLFLEDGGDIGIGTTPTYKLDINGTTAGAGVRVSSNTANDTLYYGTGTVTGAIDIVGTAISATDTVRVNIANSNSASSTANAALRLASNGASAGDPIINFSIVGQQDWAAGVDNSDSDKFKINYAANFASNNALTITTSGDVGIGDSSPASLFTVGSGDLFQVNSSGIIASIDGVAHTIDDVSGNLTLTSNSTDVVINDNLTVYQALRFANNEYIASSSNGFIQFVGAGGADNTDLSLDLDGTRPILYSATDSVIQIAEDVEISGTTGLTLTGAGGQLAFANGETIDNDTNNQINLNLGASGTLLLTSSTEASITNTAGDLNIAGIGNISFDDGTLSSAITLSDTDTSFTSGDTAIVDAINAAYAAATGGTGSLLSHADHYLYATDYWADDFIVGGNSTASADIQLFANGAATFNEQGNDSDFRIEGDTDANLFFADASTDRIGIGTNTPSQTLEVNGAVQIDGVLYFNDTSAYLTDSSNAMIINNADGVRLQDSGSTVLTALSSGIGIGTTAPDAALEINHATGDNLRLTYNDANGSAINYADFSMSSSGDLTIAPSGGDTNITGDLDVSDQIAAGSLGAITAGSVLFIDNNYTDASGTVNGIFSRAQDSVAGSQTVYGTQTTAYANSNSQTGSYAGLFGRAQKGGTGTLASATGVQGNILINGGGTITNAYGLQSSATLASSSTIGTLYNIFVATPSVSSSTLTTNYGLYLANQNTGSTNFGVYTNLGDNSFGDDILLRNDNDRLQIGAGGDLDLYHDGTDSYIANATGDLNITTADDIIFDDAQLSSAIQLTDTATSFDSGDTGIVDAINAAYQAATGGTGALLLHADHYLYASDYWADDFIVGGNSTASADIQLFANGAATFNEQGNNADFRIEGDTNTNLFFADASTDRIGIGTNAPSTLLDIASTSTSLSTGLFNVDWSPGSATTLAGDLFTINIGANGSADSLFKITDDGSTLFEVTQSKITSALPHEFTSSGDVSFAYDVIFTNPTSGNILSDAALNITAGLPYNSSNLTLSTYNSGNVVADTRAFVVGGGSGTGLFNVDNSYTDTFGKALAILNQDESQDILTASASGSTVFTLANNGDITTSGDLTVSGGDITSAATTNLLNTTTTTLNFAGAATALNINDAAVTSTIDIGGVTANGANTINIATEGTSADSISIGNSNASTTLALTGGNDWSISATGTITGSSLTDGTATLSSGTLDVTSGTLSFTTTTSGDISLASAGDISFDDSTLSSAITLTDTATSFDSGDTGIVDAINAAYQAATGGTGALLLHADHYLYASDYWADDFIVGGNSTASADIQLFANGAATFNEQGNDADFRIEGDTNANLFFADASTDRIGIGTNAPDANIDVNLGTSGAFQLTYNDSDGSAANYSQFTVNSSGDLTIAPSGGDTNVTGNLDVSGTTGLTLSGTGGQIAFANGETIDNDTPGSIVFSEATNSITFDLDATNPTLSSSTGTIANSSILDQNAAVDIDVDSATAFTLGDGSTNFLTVDTTADAADTIFTLDGTGVSTGKLGMITADAITTGIGLDLSVDALTTGTGFNITSTNTGLDTGSLFSLDWSATGSNISSADLFTINAGDSDTVGSLLKIMDNGSAVFEVTQSKITSALPHEFTSAGDVSFAYDINLVNQTASFITSKAPLYLTAGEVFESNNLTLQTYNLGDIVFENGDSGVTALFGGNGSNTFTNTTGQLSGKSVLILDQNESEDIFTASASGTTRFTIANDGEVDLTRSSAGQWLGFNDGTDNFGFYNSAGTPESSITANTGALAVDTTNGTLYIKGDDGDATGWTAVSTGSSSPFTDGTSITYLTDGSEDFSLGTGTETLTAPFSVDVSANTVRIGDGTSDANDPTLTFYASDGADSGSISFLDADEFNFTGAGLNIDSYLDIDVNLATAFTLGDGSTDFLTVDTTADAADTLFNFDTTGITTGIGLDISVDGLTSGTGMNLASTSTALTSGSLFALDWSATGSISSTADLFTINTGTGETISSFLNITEDGSDVFKVTQTGVTTAVPASFTAAGDVSVAYDLDFTNQTSSYIKSDAPLYIEAGEVFESNNLTLTTYNSGNIVLDAAGGVLIDLPGTATTNGLCHTTASGTSGEEIVDCSGAPSDYAEWYPVQANSQPGDVVGFSNEVFEYTASGAEADTGFVYELGSESINILEPANTTFLGIVSTAPYNTIGEDIKQAVDESGNSAIKAAPIALVGRVPANIASDSPAIVAGDMLALSTTQPGKVTKAVSSGQVVGQALQTWNPGDSDQILTFVKSTYYDANENTSDLANNVTELENRISSLELMIGGSESTESATTTFDDLALSSLSVSGDTVLGDTVIAGTLNVGSLQFDPTDNSINAIGILKVQPLALSNIEFMGGLITMDTEGNITANEITAEKYNVAGASAGTATLPADTVEVFVETTMVTADSLIFTNPKSPIVYPLSVTERVEGEGFWVEILETEPANVDFDWWIVDRVNN